MFWSSKPIFFEILTLTPWIELIKYGKTMDEKDPRPPSYFVSPSFSIFLGTVRVGGFPLGF